jgi:hypothetical protein
VASIRPRPYFTPGKDPVLILQEAGWVPGLVWTGAKNLAPTGIRSPDRPARSHSLYRLSYRAHSGYNTTIILSNLCKKDQQNSHSFVKALIQLYIIYWKNIYLNLCINYTSAHFVGSSYIRA